MVLNSNLNPKPEIRWLHHSHFAVLCNMTMEGSQTLLAEDHVFRARMIAAAETPEPDWETPLPNVRAQICPQCSEMVVTATKKMLA